MASNSPNSPRQKMINLMYLVFIAMLALNVSSEVLDGFELVEESLYRSAQTSTTRNELTFENLDSYHNINPEKTEKWYSQAQEVKSRSDSLYNYIAAKKLEIVRKADGKDADPEKLKHPDDLNAAFEVMIAPGRKDGEILKGALESYREFISGLLQDSIQKRIIESNLSTTPSKKARQNKQSWEESLFWQMPLAAAVTIMTKLQNDIRYAEGEALNTLLRNIDIDDFRVNKIEAYVIPETQVVMRGGTYNANLVLSAEDSTQRPKIFVNGKILPEEANGRFQAGAGSTGTFPVTGYIEMGRGDGSVLRREFSTEYMVIEPSATISPTLMNVLYAGYKNPVEIAVPGIPSQNITATMTNGTLTREGNTWIAVPSQVGADAVITVTARMDNRTQEMAKRPYRVRKLPDPLPYLEYKDDQGNPVKFRGGRISKAALIGINEVEAAIDDDLLRVDFNVLSFETAFFDSYGNLLLERSDGPRFSQRQKDYIRGLQRGKLFLIRQVVARGQDGIERTIGPLEVTIN